MTLYSQRPEPATSVQQLLLLDDAEFVRLAYLTLLGREPDDSGMDTYVGLLRAGADRRDLIAVLAESLEGRQASDAVAGLPALLAGYRPQRGILERLWRRLVPAAVHTRSDAFEQDMRRSGNRLARLESMLARQEEQIGMLRRELERLREHGPAGNDRGASPAATPQRQMPLPRQVPPAADDALMRLRRIRWLRSQSAH